VNTKQQHIHALWIGNQLSPVEILTIKSFIAHKFVFHLWLYHPLTSTLPESVIVEDAAKIIPYHNVFQYKYKNQFGHGKGSYAGFSDIFRYKLLYEHGGWWTDMDVTCLKTPDFNDEYVFRTHHSLPLVGNIMKVPPKSDLMKACYEEAHKKINESNRDWHLPIQILADNIEKFGLSEHIKAFTNPDSWNLIRTLLRTNSEIPNDWYMIHWVNEEWRRNKIDKIHYLKNSYMIDLLKKYHVYHKTAKKHKALQIRYRLSLISHLFRHII
jgi:mannosyltransferase OCH1-like enzyme